MHFSSMFSEKYGNYSSMVYIGIFIIWWKQNKHIGQYSCHQEIPSGLEFFPESADRGQWTYLTRNFKRPIKFKINLEALKFGTIWEMAFPWNFWACNCWKPIEHKIHQPHYLVNLSLWVYSHYWNKCNVIRVTVWV